MSIKKSALALFIALGLMVSIASATIVDDLVQVKVDVANIQGQLSVWHLVYQNDPVKTATIEKAQAAAQALQDDLEELLHEIV